MQADRGWALHGLLALVQGDEVEGRIRLQKEAYLLALKGYNWFQPKRFHFHYFGPYSKDLSEALHFAVASHLLDENLDSYPGGRKYSYRLTEQGRDWLASEDNTGQALVAQVRNVCRRAHWRTLELAASALFLERANEANGRQESIQKAIGLKPDCEPYSKDADKLLQQLEL